MKKYFLIFIALIFSFNLLFSQNERIAALGGATVALKDFDLDLNLYDFGGNVAGLMRDHTLDVLYIRPHYTFFKGDYLRYFDFNKSSLVGISFDGTKILKDGVFRGYVIYDYEYRRNVNRALKRNPYSGIAFFMTDTTTGDFAYNGPKVGFQYSFELLKSFFWGFELNYQLVDGLKNIYSRAKSLIRNIDGSLNLAYEFNNNISIGGKVAFYDNKESIEAKSEDLFDAEIFNYRGDTYAFKRRSQTIEQTYREKALGYSLQGVVSPVDKFNFGVRADYFTSNVKVQYPYGTLKEYEEGHSVFEDFTTTMKMQYQPFENLMIGLEGKYEDYNSWSRISELALMIWKWDLKQYNLSAGISYRLKYLPLIAVSEFTFGKIISDSSKYIDNKFVNHNEPIYSFKAGIEYEIIKRIFLRTGYQFFDLGFDPERGGKDVSINKFTFGLGIYSSKSIEIDYFTEFIFQKNQIAQSNRIINSQINLKLYNY